MKKVLIFAAVVEAATGVALLIVPSLVGQLLFGVELTGIAIPVARVAGIALIALGVACWPGTPLVGMLTYSAAVTLYLAYVGFAGGLTGILLWPAVVLHGSYRSSLDVFGWLATNSKVKSATEWDGPTRVLSGHRSTWHLADILSRRAGCPLMTQSGR